MCASSTGFTNEVSMEEIIDNDGSASSHVPNAWQFIEWRRVEMHVRTMQMRIAKATQESDWRRVKALQRSLIRSFAARSLAVRRVTENQGKRTAGVDRELWDTPTRKWEAVSALKQQRGYRSQPLRRVFIPKANGKERPLGIPTMTDRAMQALHLLGLEPVVESQSDPNSYGFRRNRSTADAMSQSRSPTLLRPSKSEADRRPGDPVFLRAFVGTAPFAARDAAQAR
jgi:RNA-directed DNA polymerase